MKKETCHCEEPAAVSLRASAKSSGEAIPKTAGRLLRPKGLAMTQHPSTLRLAAGIATLVATVLAGQGKAEAQGVEFPHEVNYIGTGADKGGVQIIPDSFRPDSFALLWSDISPATSLRDLYEARFRVQYDSATNSAKMILLGTAAPVSDIPEAYRQNHSIYLDNYLRINRGDGTTAQRILTDGGVVSINGVIKWPYGCGATTDAIHTGPVPGNMRVVASGDVFDLPMSAPDLCALLGPTTKVAELSSAYEEVVAPGNQAGTVYAITRDASGSYGPRVKTRISTGTLKHVRRDATGTPVRWVQESPQTVSGTRDFDYPVYDVKTLTSNGQPLELTIPLSRDLNTNAYVLTALLTKPPAADGSMDEVPVTMEVEAIPVEPDSDLDTIPDRDDNCPGRANPEQTDVTGPNGVPDGKGDACAANCGENFPGVSAPGEVNTAGLRDCPSELSDASGVRYANGFSDEDGSTMHSNQDVALDALGNIATAPGQKLRYIHSDYPGGTPQPARSITIPAGNSFRMKIHSTDELDGTPGSITVTHTSYPDGAITTDTFTAASDWFEYGVSMGDVVGLEGCDVEIEVGEENLPIDCAHVVSLCPPNPDGGAADGGNGNADSGTSTTDSGTADSGTDGGSSSTDAGGHGPDASYDAGTTWTDAGTEYDAGGADATTSTSDGGGQDAATPEDAGHENDAGPADAADANNPDHRDGGPPDAPDAQNPQQDAGEDASGRDSGHIQEDAATPDGNPAKPDAARPRADEGDDGGGCSCKISKTQDGRFSIETLGLVLGALALKTRRRLQKLLGE